MTTSAQAKQQVVAVIEEWKAALSRNDVARVKRLWDQDYSNLLYIAEENNDAVKGWKGVSDYYDGLAKAVRRADWRVDNLVVDVIGDAAFAYCTFVVKALIAGVDNGKDREMVFDGRDTFVLHHKGGQWKIIHYHESLSRDHSHGTWGWTFAR